MTNKKGDRCRGGRPLSEVSPKRGIDSCYYTPVVVEAQQLSEWEFCARLVELNRSFEPPSWPVRLAIRRYLFSALKARYSGMPPDIAREAAVDAFTDEATERGYTHPIPVSDPRRNAYTLIKDYACWLEGALHLAEELDLVGEVEPLPLVAAGADLQVHVDAWAGQWEPHVAHTFRLADRATSPLAPFTPKWPEVAAALSGCTEVRVHAFLLPAARKDRLPSPLCLAFQHPLTAHLRLATLPSAGEKEFGRGWKKVARWELVNTDMAFTWPEWRDGIDNDQCEDKCWEHHTWKPGWSPEQLAREYRSFKQIVEAVALGSGAIRKREVCGRCYMVGLCHDPEPGKLGYRTKS